MSSTGTHRLHTNRGEAHRRVPGRGSGGQHIGRIGGLAAALGVGAFLFAAPWTAAADSDDSSSSSTNSSSSSSTSSGASSATSSSPSRSGSSSSS
ncbi:MAG: hypothetical protein U1C73_15270, partial [Dietzia sp.]|nr:hypothetical protein [Dietzia sp.]